MPAELLEKPIVDETDPEPQSSESLLGNPYFDLIKKLSSEEFQPPASPEDATQRILAAADVLEGLQPPEVDLPDTPRRNLKQLLLDREEQYWMEHGEIRKKGEFLQEVGYDTTLQANALRLISNLPHDVPDSVLNWALAKTFLAGRIWREVMAAAPYTRDKQFNLDDILDPDYRSAILDLRSGQARIEIHEGRPILRPYDSGTAAREVIDAIYRSNDSWVEKHKLLARSHKLRRVLPFLANMATSVRSGNGLFNLFQYSALLHYREQAKAAQKVDLPLVVKNMAPLAKHPQPSHITALNK